MDRLFLSAGLIQLAAVFTPAARVRLLGTISFFNLPTAGPVLVALAVLSIAMAFGQHRWWRWVPGLLAGIVSVVAYQRIANAPSGRFFDPVVRHIVHPAWGFIPMMTAVALTLAATAYGRYAMQSISTRSPSPGSAAA